MKIFKRKHFQALIYSIFLALPLLSVLGRCVYTIANKNAKDSYYGETINDSAQEFLNPNSFIADKKYYFSNQGEIAVSNDFPYSYFNVRVVENFGSVQNVNNADFDILDSNIMVLRKGNNDQLAIEFKTTRIDTSYYLINTTTNNAYFSFIYLSHTTDSKLNQLNNNFYEIVYNEYSYLDNAFEYSIDRFVSENDYGNFDFFQWFSTFFLSNTSINNLYIHFVNWYLNYVLYVSLGYLIFSVLFWFVNFFRRLVEDTQNINVGGM